MYIMYVSVTVGYPVHVMHCIRERCYPRKDSLTSHKKKTAKPCVCYLLSCRYRMRVDVVQYHTQVLHVFFWIVYIPNSQVRYERLILPGELVYTPFL